MSFQLESSQTLGIVGESGCGKSTLALALLRLHPPLFQDRSILKELLWSICQKSKWQPFGGKGMALVFQESGAGLNPIYSLGRQISKQ